MNKGFKTFIEFFLAPLAIFITALTIFLFFNWLFSKETNTQKLLTELNSAAIHKKWRIAYDLATNRKHLDYIRNNSTGYLTIHRMLKDMLIQYPYIPASEKESATRFIEYLIYLFSFCNNSEVNTFLRENLLRPDNNFLNVTILSIGNTKRTELVEDIIKIYTQAPEDTQLVILYVLGILPTPEGKKILMKEFYSNNTLKKLNSAFALARIGEKSVLPYFKHLLEKENYKLLEISEKGILRKINEQEERYIIENILKSLTNFNPEQLEELKETLIELESKTKYFTIRRILKELILRINKNGRR
ncbi:MAG: hypothetical protein ACK4NF_02025 [Planctomycetota bacterium]